MQDKIDFLIENFTFGQKIGHGKKKIITKFFSSLCQHYLCNRLEQNMVP